MSAVTKLSTQLKTFVHLLVAPSLSSSEKKRTEPEYARGAFIINVIHRKSVEDVLPKIEEEVKKVRKNVGLALVPMVTKAYLKPRWNKLCAHTLKPYIKKCVHVAWLMCVQTPPMAIEALPKHGEKLDTNLYREYSRRGQTVDFVVWPVVLLKEPQNEMLSVMTKGVAEVKEL